MDLNLFEELTGITVDASQQAVVEAQIGRTQKLLEAMLGFTLDPDRVQQNLYNERGKAKTNCFCPSTELDNPDLDDPDEVVNAYRLFSYNPNDKFWHVDPFTEIHAVKLSWNGITTRTFDADDFRAEMAQGWSKFIENCDDDICVCTCFNCIQLAIDADWLFVCDQDNSIGDSSTGCVNDELLYVWADMIAYYADCKQDVRSESIGAHTYSKYDKVLPEDQPHNLMVLKKYAGPHGTLTKVITP